MYSILLNIGSNIHTVGDSLNTNLEKIPFQLNDIWSDKIHSKEETMR